MSIGAIKFAWGVRPGEVRFFKTRLILAVYLGGMLHHLFLPWGKTNREYVLSAMSFENGGVL